MSGINPVKNGGGSMMPFDPRLLNSGGEMPDPQSGRIPQKLLDKTVNEAIQILNSNEAAKYGGVNKHAHGMSHVITGTAEIDEPDSEAAQAVDFEKLLALLQLECDMEQLKHLKRTVSTLLEKLKGQHSATMNKMSKAIDKAVEAEKARKRNGIFGWVMTAIAVIAAIATTIVTAGSAAPGAAMIVGCVLGCVGAGIGLTNQILQATGAMDKIIDHFAEKYAKKHGCTMNKARERVSQIMQFAQMALTVALSLASISCTITGLVNIAKSTAALGQSAYRLSAGAIKAAKIVSAGCQILSLGGGTAQSILAFLDLDLQRDAAKLQAALMMLQKLLERIQEMIEKNQKALLFMMEKVQGDFSRLFEIMTCGEATVDQILSKFSQSGLV